MPINHALPRIPAESRKYNAFDLVSFIGVAAGLAGVSAILKALASVLIVVPIIGWLMSSVIAFGFIMIFGHIADGHYSKLARRPSVDIR